MKENLSKGSDDGKPRIKASYCPTIVDIKPPKIINDTFILWNNEKYYELVGKYTDGHVRVKYYFEHGYIEVDRGYVIGGEICFKDGDYPINVYIFNGDLAISKNTGVHMWQFTTNNSLKTGDKYLSKQKVESVLKKRYDELFVDEFMRLANDIYLNSNEYRLFDFRYGERND